MSKKNLKVKSIQDVHDEIFRKMSADEKVRLTLKLSSEIFRPVRDKIKSQYPDLHPVLLSKKIYSYIDSNREYYNNLFNQKLEKELKTWVNFKNH